jgi:beta-lactamase class A
MHRRRIFMLQVGALLGAGVLVATLTTIAIQLTGSRRPHTVAAAAAPSPQAAQPSPAPKPTPKTLDGNLTAKLNGIISNSTARVAVTVVDLGAKPATRVDIGGTDDFEAGSTYKLPVLMANAENIASGAYKASDKICFKDDEGEDGWFDDYSSGSCFTRQTLAMRAGRYSDNTAGHMLVDNLGGGDALNVYAKRRGASQSTFFVPNQTCSSDLATLLVTEASGRAGGQAAQSWLYPLLTKTAFEQGIPAGVPPSVTIVHKVGAVDGVVADAGIVMAPKGAYVIVVMTDLLGGDAAYSLIAQISSAVWSAETA